MLAFIAVTIDIVVLVALVLISGALGFLINNARIKKQKKSISKLESEMLDNHAEILRLQKEMSDKESLHSKTPVFSIHETAAEVQKEQAAGVKKVVAGRGKSTS